MLTVLLMEWLMAAPLALEGPGVPARAHTLDDVRWEQRVLLLFPGDKPEAWTEQQEKLEKARSALDQRDVLVVVVGGDPEAPVRIPDDRAARERWKVSPGEARAVLVGKDGQEKWRATLPASLKPVFTLIDGMPMRQQEMRDRHPKGAD
ncbi:MAG: DUF4174 domain-containing protein [Cystobacter sp.]